MESFWKYFLIAPPDKSIKYTYWEKVQTNFTSKPGLWHIKIFVMTEGTQIWCFFKLSILDVGNITKNVVFGANNTPNLPLKLVSIFCFWSYRPAKHVKMTKILLCIQFQLWTIFQSQKRLYNHKCLFVRPLSKPLNSLKSSSFIHPSSFYLHFATFNLFSLFLKQNNFKNLFYYFRGNLRGEGLGQKIFHNLKMNNRWKIWNQINLIS